MSYMIYLSIPMLIVGIWHLIKYGSQIRVTMFVGIIGILLIQLHLTLVIEFKGTIITSMPFLIGTIGIMYIPWYVLT